MKQIRVLKEKMKKSSRTDDLPIANKKYFMEQKLYIEISMDGESLNCRDCPA